MKKLFFLALFLFVFLQLHAQEWTEIQKILSSDITQSDAFGCSVSISGDYAIVGAYAQDFDTAGNNTKYWAGAAYIFKRNKQGNWNQTQKLISSDRTKDDFFGNAVSIHGDYAIVGAVYEDEDESGINVKNNAGSAYIFEKDENEQWEEVQKIVASDRDAEDNFACALSIHGDFVVIGAKNESEDVAGNNTQLRAGSAYIFKRGQNGVWIETQKLVTSDRKLYDEFGNSLCMTDQFIIFGTRDEEEDENGSYTLSHAGSAYIFEKAANDYWFEAQKIVASDRSVDDFFGYSAAISGNYAVVGAAHEDHSIYGTHYLEKAGSVYIFEKDGDEDWTQVQKIVAPDRIADVRFGSSVAIDGNTILVGEFRDTSKPTKGLVYIIKRSLTGEWSHLETIVSSDIEDGDLFGEAISIDKKYAIVGAISSNFAHGHLERTTGQAYVFETTTVGLEENGLSDKFTIYPNPTKGQIIIDLGREYKDVKVNLRNVVGQLVLAKTYEKNQFINLDIDGLSGFYLLEISTNKNQTAIYKICKE
ncbi:MAG: T9SS type A sorting domain-containing protein [Bacteroidetes bacterium]|nr:T9SS type A sorting domain-containing protein [Bacteroidota bacterium]